MQKILTVTDATTAYNLELGAVPTYMHVQNITQHAANSTKVEFTWYKGMADGYYMGMENLGTAATDGRKPINGTSNGFTLYNEESFVDQKLVIDTGATKITKAANAVVTCTDHGLATGDKVSFQCITSGMTEINGRSTKITRINSSSFSCDNIDSTGFTTWDAAVTAGLIMVISKLQQNEGKCGMTLGTDILCTNADVLLIDISFDENFETVTQA